MGSERGCVRVCPLLWTLRPEPGGGETVVRTPKYSRCLVYSVSNPDCTKNVLNKFRDRRPFQGPSCPVPRGSTTPAALRFVKHFDSILGARGTRQIVRRSGDGTRRAPDGPCGGGPVLLPRRTSTLSTPDGPAGTEVRLFDSPSLNFPTGAIVEEGWGFVTGPRTTVGVCAPDSARTTRGHEVGPGPSEEDPRHRLRASGPGTGHGCAALVPPQERTLPGVSRRH